MLDFVANAGRTVGKGNNIVDNVSAADGLPSSVFVKRCIVRLSYSASLGAVGWRCHDGSEVSRRISSQRFELRFRLLGRLVNVAEGSR
jgi:hypothetical protein